MSPPKRTLAALVVAGGLTLTLTGCIPAVTQWFPLPDEERYQFIEPVKEALDIETAGTVLEARYDTGGGVISPSFFAAKVQGEDAFEILTERLQAVDAANCRPVTPTGLSCWVKQAQVQIGKEEPYSDNIVALLINDGFSGRVAE